MQTQAGPGSAPTGSMSGAGIADGRLKHVGAADASVHGLDQAVLRHGRDHLRFATRVRLFVPQLAYVTHWLLRGTGLPFESGARVYRQEIVENRSFHMSSGTQCDVATPHVSGNFSAHENGIGEHIALNEGRRVDHQRVGAHLALDMPVDLDEARRSDLAGHRYSHADHTRCFRAFGFNGCGRQRREWFCLFVSGDHRLRTLCKTAWDLSRTHSSMNL